MPPKKYPAKKVKTGKKAANMRAKHLASSGNSLGATSGNDSTLSVGDPNDYTIVPGTTGSKVPTSQIAAKIMGSDTGSDSDDVSDSSPLIAKKNTSQLNRAGASSSRSQIGATGSVSRGGQSSDPNSSRSQRSASRGKSTSKTSSNVSESTTRRSVSAEQKKTSAQQVGTSDVSSDSRQVTSTASKADASASNRVGGQASTPAATTTDRPVSLSPILPVRGTTNYQQPKSQKTSTSQKQSRTSNDASKNTSGRSGSRNTTTNAGAARVPKKGRMKTSRMMREIRELQSCGKSGCKLLIPKLPFQRAARQITTSVWSENNRGAADLRFTPQAMLATQEATEAYLVCYFQALVFLTGNRNAKTLQTKDFLTLACILQILDKGDGDFKALGLGGAASQINKYF